MQTAKNLSSIKSIVFFANRPIVANIFMLLLIFCGTIAFKHTKKEVFPEFSDDTIEIETEYTGASPLDVEQSIILPIENEISTLPGIKEIKSKAEEGKALVIAKLYNGEDVDLVRQRIQDNVARIEVFPETAKKPVVRQNINKINVLKIILFGEHADKKILKYYADKIYDNLKNNNEIGPLEIQGLQDLDIYIDVDKTNLKKYKISLTDIAAEVEKFSLDKSSGTIKTSSGDIALRINEKRNYATDFDDIPIIESTKGRPVKLGEIAKVYEEFSDKNDSARYSGIPAVAIDVFRVGNLTPAIVSNAVKSELQKLQPSLPSSLKAVVVDDRSKVFMQRAELLKKNGIIGLCLVLILLGLFLEIRFAFWIGLGIPISFFGAFLLFPFADISINMVTMFAFIMCLGIVVDDAIIVGENIYSYRCRGYSALDAAIKGASEVAAPVTFSVLTNIVAFLPLFFVPGVMGKIFIYIPAVVVSVFFISLIESLFILPAHLACVKGITADRDGVRNNLLSLKANFVSYFAKFIGNIYDNIISFTIRNKYFVLSTAISAFLICLGLVLGGRMGMELFPDVESDIASVTATLPPGSSLKNLTLVENKLLDSANRVLNKYNSQEISHGIYSTIKDNEVNLKMYLVDASERSISTRDIIKAWRDDFGNVPGIDSMTYSVNDRGPGAGPDLTIELAHDDIVSLKLAALWLADSLRSYGILSGIDDGISKGKRQWSFILNDNAVSLGITSQQVASQVKAAFHGVDALTQHRGRDEIDVVVRLPKYQRDSEHDIEHFIIHTNDGAEVMLGDIVDIREDISYSKIDRKNSNRVIAVTAEAYPKSELVNVQADLEENIFPLMIQKFPGISYKYGGEQTDISESMSSLFTGLAIALAMMYALLTVLFNSLLQPLIILFVIPFSFIGVVLGHLILGYSLSVLSLFGVVALTGVVINDGVVLMRFINSSLQQLAFTEAILEATKRRAFPVCLTSVTTFVSLLPIITESSMQAQFLIPMAVSLASGVIFAMLVTLILIPAICSILDDFKLFYGKRRIG
ncbi:MAG: efflux RND transporter permease subunit [Pseudomonadota bacterium]|nr:efflux RND transporter permease subunit [Pseudomonadota bacterium]